MTDNIPSPPAAACEGESGRALPTHHLATMPLDLRAAFLQTELDNAHARIRTLEASRVPQVVTYEGQELESGVYVSEKIAAAYVWPKDREVFRKGHRYIRIGDTPVFEGRGE